MLAAENIHNGALADHCASWVWAFIISSFFITFVLFVAPTGFFDILLCFFFPEQFSNILITAELGPYATLPRSSGHCSIG